jgi:hypothetical protein
MRARFHPTEGQLYTSGLAVWATNCQTPGGFYRVRYNGKPAHPPIATIAGAARCIADHCSFSWSTNEIVSIVHASDLITIQWYFINEALNFRDHAFGTASGGERPCGITISLPTRARCLRCLWRHEQRTSLPPGCKVGVK